MLKRVKVHNYKSLVDTEVELRPLSVLFGANAAGKSNFLDALQLLSGFATQRTLKDAFLPPYRGKPLESLTFGDGGVQGLLEKESVTFSIEVDVELSQTTIDQVDRQIRDMRRARPGTGPEGKGPSAIKEPSAVKERWLRYGIEVAIRPQTGIVQVSDEYLAALTASGVPTGKRRAFLEQVQDRLHLRMEGQAHPTYHERYLDHSVLSMPLYPPHYPHLVAMRQELANWLFFYFEPRERMRAPTPVREVRHIGQMGEDLAAFLNTLKAIDPVQFEAVERSLSLLIPSVTGIDVMPNSLGEVEMRLREGNTLMPARVLSEGTLRLLGLLALGGARERPTLIGFEEPENGVHPRRIRLIAEYLQTVAASGTQLIVTTHSPLLADLIPEDSLLACRKERGRTVMQPLAHGGLSKTGEIEAGIDAEEAGPTAGTRILHGDFDA